MTNYPSSLDDDNSIPPITSNVLELNSFTLSAVRSAIFAIQSELGLGLSGNSGTLSNRLDFFLNPDGTIKPSSISSLGLVTLPITNSHISSSAQINESKLNLDHSTIDLFNYITSVANSSSSFLGWLNTTGIKLDPHILGAGFNHEMVDILIGQPSTFFKNKLEEFRDNSSLYNLFNDLNFDILSHYFSDGTLFSGKFVVTHSGISYPDSFAHTAAGIHLNSSNLNSIPRGLEDLQSFVNYIDNQGIFLLGTRIQNLYSNGISRSSRSPIIFEDGYGQSVVPPTPATAFLLGTDNSTLPIDDIYNGDDIIEFHPEQSEIDSNNFDALFSLVKPGDILKFNYDGIEVSHIVKEIKYIQNLGNKRFIVRVNSRNIKYVVGTARIDKPLFNKNKYGVLSLSQVNNNFASTPSLIATNPNSAMTLGLGFNADLIDSSNYLLYLALYPSGNPEDGQVLLPGIDITGNFGQTPGAYNLDNIVYNTNENLRKAGINSRFIAFSYEGEFGIALADNINGASFSIINGIVDNNGLFDQAATVSQFPSNVVQIFNLSGLSSKDALGLGIKGTNIASPVYTGSYASPEAAQNPTKLIIPLRRNNFYVNGSEKDSFLQEPNQLLDSSGNGYWPAIVVGKNIIPSMPNGRFEVIYQIPIDLKSSSLQIGKTLVVEKGSVDLGYINYGRFIIKDLNYDCCSGDAVQVTVYDAIHANTVTPVDSINVDDEVRIYFSKDSITFNNQNASDESLYNSFKRYFEIYIDDSGKTFTHERARLNSTNSNITINNGVLLRSNSEINKINIHYASPKLRGYRTSSINKITLNIIDLDSFGNFSGYLCNYDGVTISNKGPVAFGKLGEIVRFFDESNLDYIDFKFDISVSTLPFSNYFIDIQLFASLLLNEEIMSLGSCQIHNNKITNLIDLRTFGNTSEKDFTTSAIKFIESGSKYLHLNGVIQGFDLSDFPTNPNENQIYLTGGLALVNGKFVQVNSATIEIPVLKDGIFTDINWALCLSSKGEYKSIPLLDYDIALNNSTNPNRAITAYNPANGQSYDLFSSTFSNIINNQKDLVILYIVRSNYSPVTPITKLLQVFDARRSAYEVDSSLPLRLSFGNSQGNFKSVESIISWLLYNNEFNGRAFIKNADLISGAVNTPTLLDFNSTVSIDGENNAIISFNEEVKIGSNITFKNLTVNFNDVVEIINSSSNILFNNCIINFNYNLVNESILNFFKSSNIIFNNCSINWSASISGTSGTVFYFNDCIDIDFNKCNFNINYDFDQALNQVPGSIILFNETQNININNNNIIGSYAQFIAFNTSDNIVIEKNNIITNFSPFSIPFNENNDSTLFNLGFSNITFDNNNSINSGRAVILFNCITSLESIYINNNKFTFSPITSISNRLTFINFELKAANIVLRNLNISNNTFNHSMISSSFDDTRAAIAVINKVIGTQNTLRPTLSHCFINNNNCNRSQGIYLTSQTFGADEIMEPPGLAVNNVSVENNICGNIGYFTTSAIKIVNIAPSVSTLSDIFSGIIISKNTCKLIYNCDHRGKYFFTCRNTTGTLTNRTNIVSGNIIISSNFCHWIHVGIASINDSTLEISNNKLQSYNINYLNEYLQSYSLEPTDAIYNSYNESAICVFSTIETSSSGLNFGNRNNVRISDNFISEGFWKNILLSNINYLYKTALIVCQASATITNNYCSGIDTFDGDNLNSILFVGGSDYLISNNRMYRNLSNLALSYILHLSFNGISSDLSYGYITDNYFDKSSVSNSALDNNIFSIFFNGNWVVERNLNQVQRILLPLTSNSILFETITDANTLRFSTAPDFNGPPSVGKSNILRIHDSANVGTGRNFLAQFNLNNHLPKNAKILNARFSIRAFNDNFSLSANSFRFLRFSLSKYTTALSSLIINLNTFAGPWLGGAVADGLQDTRILHDVAGNASQFRILTTNTLSNLNSNEVFIDLRNSDLLGGPGTEDLVDRYPITETNHVNLSIYFTYSKINSDSLYIYVSPVLVNYKW